MIVIATGPSGKVTAEAAYPLLASGSPPLDAVEAGLRAAEADTSLTDIGFGGMPDASGQLSLDAALMDGATHRAGAVAGLYGCQSPVRIARRVLEKTPHVFLVGHGAREFATAQGFADEGALLTEHAASEWARFRSGERALESTGDEPSDTVGAVALGHDGNLAVGTSTSGLAFKMPGRVGDSPIIGSGLYVENAIGGAVCLGMGEQMMQVCMAFRVVQELARGLSPDDACAAALAALIHLKPQAARTPCLTIALTPAGVAGGAAITSHPDLVYYAADASGLHRVAVRQVTG
jgi:L-asparaginase/N4-(beta-N-acetylglucosaminyl)-L-asparaginase